MFKIDDLIVYGSTGVCRIEDIKSSDLMGDGEVQLCYVLKPLYHDYVITTPVENTKIFLRPIITKEAAEQLIDMIPSIQVEPFHSSVVRELTEHYKAYLDTHDCSDLIKMTMSIYAKRKELEQNNRKFGQVDQRFLKQAEELLFGELSAALCIPRESVPQYIKSRVNVLIGEDSFSDSDE